ncbi:MAG: GNAT family N-acetyltransferase [Bacteroidales bacterium]|nr:GNAT family N-acetyltransferase [Bacteroidales bacterium]
MIKYLENTILKLRALEPTDIELLYQWENDTSLWRVSNTLAPFSRHTLSKYLESAHLDIFEVKQLRLMIDLKEDDSIITIGAIDLFDFDPYHLRAGIGILIADTSQRNKGYAAGALDLLIKYCFEMLQLHQLYCNITTDNKVSIKLFTNAGFKIIGEKKDWVKTMNSWIGEYMLQLLKEE